MFYKKSPSLSLLAISISLIFMHNSAIAKNITVDLDKSKNTTISKNSDGIETIYIDKANDIGLSVNYFDSFNVGKEGINIDNSEVKAKAILSEVTSSKTSLLEGRLSVLGQDATLIIANPNGIDCNGCQFSGSDSVVLISGKFDSVKGDNFYLSDGYVNLTDVINLNKEQKINAISNRINILNKNKIPLFNAINGYESVSFIDYVWEGEQEKALSKNKKEGINILEGSSLRSHFLSLQGGILNLDGKIRTKKINIIENKEINGNEKAVLTIINDKNEFREYNKAELRSTLASMKLQLIINDTTRLNKISKKFNELEVGLVEEDPQAIHEDTKKIKKTAAEAREIAHQALNKVKDAKNMSLKIDQVTQEEQARLEANKKIPGSEKQYIESNNINYKGSLNVINSEVNINARNINFDSDPTKVTSYFKNSGVLFNAHEDNNYSGKFGLINSDVKFLGNRLAQIGNNNADDSVNERLDKNEINDINLNKLSMFGYGNVVLLGEDVNLTDTKFKIKEKFLDGKFYESNINLISNNEINIKGQFKTSLINKNNLFKYANKITENGEVTFDINKIESQ